MEALTIMLAVAAFAALFVSIIQIGSLTVLAVGKPGIGRVLFLTLVSLKLWAGAILCYFLIGVFWPGILSRDTRGWVRLWLAVYLVVHPIGVNIAVWRWKHKEE